MAIWRWISSPAGRRIRRGHWRSSARRWLRNGRRRRWWRAVRTWGEAGAEGKGQGVGDCKLAIEDLQLKIDGSPERGTPEHPPIRWLVSPRYDLVFFIGSCALTFAFYGLYRVAHHF